MLVSREQTIYTLESYKLGSQRFAFQKKMSKYNENRERILMIIERLPHARTSEISRAVGMTWKRCSIFLNDLVQEGLIIPVRHGNSILYVMGG